MPSAATLAYITVLYSSLQGGKTKKKKRKMIVVFFRFFLKVYTEVITAVKSISNQSPPVNQLHTAVLQWSEFLCHVETYSYISAANINPAGGKYLAVICDRCAVNDTCAQTCKRQMADTIYSRNPYNVRMYKTCLRSKTWQTAANFFALF